MTARTAGDVLALGGLVALSACVQPISVILPRDGLDSGVLDGGARDASMTDAALPIPDAARRLSAGQTHTCAIIGGGLYCWGGNEHGQAGQIGTSSVLRPERIGPESDWEQVMAGEAFTCAVRDGELHCVGRNDHGQLGLGDDAPRDVLTRVPLPRRVVSADVGYAHVCAILEGGRLYCWGYNAEGQLGLDSTLDVWSPTEVPTANNWAGLGLGRGATLALTSDGEIWGVGGNSRGELGLGEGAPIQRWTLTLIADGAWMRADHDHAHSCALSANGMVYCFGHNSSAELGSGDRETRWTPSLVGGLGGVARIATGTFHSCAIGDAGSLACWGRNAEGQLGTGDNGDRTSPATVSGTPDGWAEVTGGRYHTCAMRHDETVWCTGANFSGQLGFGTLGDRTTALTRVELGVP